MSQQDTIAFYNQNAQFFIKQTLDVDMSAIYNIFLTKLTNNCISYNGEIFPKILDLGCGSGRDSLFFSKLGFDVVAIDGSTNIINITKNIHDQSNITWENLSFDDVINHYERYSFTGIWACASLLHIPYIELPVLINQLLALLNTHGVFYASFKYGNNERVKDGRFFCDMNEDRWESIRTKLNSSRHVSSWVTQDNRSDRNELWFNILMYVD